MASIVPINLRCSHCGRRDATPIRCAKCGWATTACADCEALFRAGAGLNTCTADLGTCTLESATGTEGE